MGEGRLTEGGRFCPQPASSRLWPPKKAAAAKIGRPPRGAPFAHADTPTYLGPLWQFCALPAELGSIRFFLPFFCRGRERPVNDIPQFDYMGGSQALDTGCGSDALIRMRVACSLGR
jgi:hypothetical protein